MGSVTQGTGICIWLSQQDLHMEMGYKSASSMQNTCLGAFSKVNKQICPH